jgi:FMN phosphatase YigB (HAD superfamily)
MLELLSPMNDLVFLVDVDNTLIDNDAVKADLAARVEGLVGPGDAARFWSTYEEVRRERDVVDFPHTLERLSSQLPDTRGFARLAALVLGYPFERSVYPGAREALGHMRALGPAAIVSDGDPVFQAAKIARAGLADLVDRIFITTHKERELARVMEALPAARYVMVDDKPRILASLKSAFGERILTLHVCQGHYAHAEEHRSRPYPDRTVDHISEVAQLTNAELTGGAAAHG